MNKYYFINKFDQSHLDKQDKNTTIIYRNYNDKIDYKTWVIRIAQAKKRIRDKKKLKKENLPLKEFNEYSDK